MSWTAYVKTLLYTVLASIAVVYAWILIVDPYDTVWFSAPVEREPVSKNQRFSYPAIARHPRFDSLVVGTSSIRLLRPSRLDPLLGASFANLAMNAATPYEQSEILKLFARNHPTVRYAFLGIDDMTYCHPKEPYPQFTHRPFPPWMYDENRWNDLLYLFNSATVEMAWRQFRNILGLRKPKFGSDGYTDFLRPESEYDLQKARSLIYGEEPPHIKPAIDPPQQVAPVERAGWSFPNLRLLAETLHALPAETSKALIFPPYHHFRLPAPGSRQAVVIAECKARVARLADTVPNTTVIDFSQRSRITLKDENYWDPGHYKVGIAPILEKAVVEAIHTGRGEAGFYSILAWPGRPAERPHTAALKLP